MKYLDMISSSVLKKREKSVIWIGKRKKVWGSKLGKLTVGNKVWNFSEGNLLLEPCVEVGWQQKKMNHNTLLDLKSCCNFLQLLWLEGVIHCEQAHCVAQQIRQTKGHHKVHCSSWITVELLRRPRKRPLKLFIINNVC